MSEVKHFSQLLLLVYLLQNMDTLRPCSVWTAIGKFPEKCAAAKHDDTYASVVHGCGILSLARVPASPLQPCLRRPSGVYRPTSRGL